MNIILLSGGSGKRMWPLSNDIRSKQFIKFFNDGNGNKESMVQRVFRQIKTCNTNTDVTIATSETQVDIIKNQLGDKVSICVEPCRRDTFPAIALSVAYLYYELKIDLEESIIVCPVDPFVDDAYYEAFNKLDELVQTGTSNITLMGIEPNYPSEKYGYIMPCQADIVSKVESFKEKPDCITAQKYIERGALWNAGVFGFKLKYLIEKTHALIEYSDYKELLSKYKDLEKISFDYAIVEKETSIQVLRYKGNWKDVGTWNALADVLEEKIQGNVIIDEKSDLSCVINELGIPVLGMGIKNMVVVVGKEGILVTDKDRSDYVKSYVEQIEDDIRYEESSWGTSSTIDKVKNATTKKLFINKGKAMNVHQDNTKKIWTIIDGCGTISIDKKEYKAFVGDVFKIECNSLHSVIADTDLCIIETQIHN